MPDHPRTTDRGAPSALLPPVFSRRPAQASTLFASGADSPLGPVFANRATEPTVPKSSEDSDSQRAPLPALSIDAAPGDTAFAADFPDSSFESIEDAVFLPVASEGAPESKTDGEPAAEAALGSAEGEAGPPVEEAVPGFESYDGDVAAGADEVDATVPVAGFTSFAMEIEQYDDGADDTAEAVPVVVGGYGEESGGEDDAGAAASDWSIDVPAEENAVEASAGESGSSDGAAESSPGESAASDEDRDAGHPSDGASSVDGIWSDQGIAPRADVAVAEILDENDAVGETRDETDATDSGGFELVIPVESDSIESGEIPIDAGPEGGVAEPDIEAGTDVGAGDLAAEVAARLERLARAIRDRGASAVDDEIRSVDRLDALLAGVLAGYFAAKASAGE